MPLLLDIRETGEAGTPIVPAAPDGAAAKAYGAIAVRGLEALGRRKQTGPKIVMD